MPAERPASSTSFLHGCNTSYAQIGEPGWFEFSGHRMWADTNNIILLFPQALPDEINPEGCWDYRGWYGNDYDQKSGVQMVAIMGMIAKITSGYQPPTANNYQGLWWATGGTDSGWGINFVHQGNQVFATWYTYDTSGKAWWLSMLAGRTTPSSNEYTGDINVDVGPPFNNFVGSATPTKVGTGTLTFSDANNGTFHYDLNAGTGGSPVLVSQTKAIERYNLGTGPQPTCTFSPTANLALATNYQDLWWAAEIGWGINFAHQGDSVFLTWYTYDSGGAPLWLSALTQRQGATNVYTGSLLRTSGPRFDNYKASDVVMPIPAVGTATLTFANGNSATFTYTTTGNTGLPAVTNQVKSIVRFPITAGGTLCQ